MRRITGYSKTVLLALAFTIPVSGYSAGAGIHNCTAKEMEDLKEFLEKHPNDPHARNVALGWFEQCDPAFTKRLEAERLAREPWNNPEIQHRFHNSLSSLMDRDSAVRYQAKNVEILKIFSDVPPENAALLLRDYERALSVGFNHPGTFFSDDTPSAFKDPYKRVDIVISAVGRAYPAGITPHDLRKKMYGINSSVISDDINPYRSLMVVFGLEAARKLGWDEEVARSLLDSKPLLDGIAQRIPNTPDRGERLLQTTIRLMELLPRTAKQTGEDTRQLVDDMLKDRKYRDQVLDAIIPPER